MDEESEKVIVELLYKIREKIIKITQLNDILVDFNYKLEALLVSFNEVSDLEKQKELSSIIQSQSEIFCANELVERANENIPRNKFYKQGIEKIINVLLESQGTIDDLCKKTGLNKFKCAEIVSYLTGLDPPVVIKNSNGIFSVNSE